VARSRCVPSNLYGINSIFETEFRRQLIGVHSCSFVVVIWLSVEQGRRSLLASRPVLYYTVIHMKLDLGHMSREEKLRTMHELWEDLARDSQDLESPSWHAAALKETAERFERGEEPIRDWADAKQELRKRMG
jgi:hypothetical protein